MDQIITFKNPNLDQIITFKNPKLGPDNNFTARANMLVFPGFGGPDRSFWPDVHRDIRPKTSSLGWFFVPGILRGTLRGAVLIGCTPKGAYGNTAFWEGFWEGSGKGSGEGVLRRVLRRGSSMGFTVKKGSEKGSQKGFWEGGFQKVPRTPPCRVRPLRRAPKVNIAALTKEVRAILPRSASAARGPYWQRRRVQQREAMRQARQQLATAHRHRRCTLRTWDVFRDRKKGSLRKGSFRWRNL